MSSWGLWGLHTAAEDWTPPVRHSSSLPSVGHCGNNEWGEGLCGHLALAFKNMYPDMKLGMEVGSQHGDINHAWAYGEDGRSHDFMGTHDGSPYKMEGGSDIHLDVDPQDLAESMGIDYDPDEDHCWDNQDTLQAGHLINRHWLGDDSYDADDGHYDPEKAEGRGGTHTAAVEADVADDLMRLAGLHGDLPEGLTFQHHPPGFEPFPDVIMPTVDVSSAWPTVSAYDGDKMIGHLQWDDSHPRKKGQIWDLRVHPDYQRRGVATALFDWTTDNVEPDLQHSNNLSDEGRAFAESEVKRPLAEERYEAWRNGQPMPKRFAMAWQDWAPHIQSGPPTNLPNDRRYRQNPDYYTTCPPGGGCDLFNENVGDPLKNQKEGRYFIDHVGDGNSSDMSYLRYSHRRNQFTGDPQLQVEHIHTHPDYRRNNIAESFMRRMSEDHPGIPISPGKMSEDGFGFHNRMLDKEPDARGVLARLAMAWDQWAPQINGGCDDGCDHDRMMMGEYSIDHPNGSGPQVGDLMPGIKGRSLLQFTHDTDQHGNPELYVSGIHVDENHRRDGIAEALMRRMHQDHPDTPINPGFTTDDGQGLLDGLKKRIPEAGEALVPRFSYRLAAPVNRQLVHRLFTEFHHWANNEGANTVPSNWPPLGHWASIESFLHDRYPASHRGLEMGSEEAGNILDGHDPMPYMVDSGMDTRPYETGPEAENQHGYDPKEIAAGMLLLHNGAHSGRGRDVETADWERLHDIAQKRYQMQRDYEQRQPPPVTASIVRRDGEDDVVDCPSCLTESLTDDYNHGGHCPVCGQFNWEYDEHRHGSLRTAMPTWYHLTDDPNFKLDPSKVPTNLNYYNLGAGVFLTQRPEEWASSSASPAWPSEQEDDDEWNGNRPYVAEIDAPDDLHKLPGTKYAPDAMRPHDMPGADEIFVPDHQFHHLHVKNVKPRWASRTAMPTYYHHTDNPNFQPDSDHEPISMRNLNHPGGPGIFLTPEERPDMWRRGPDSYRAEFHSDEDVAQKPGVFSENYGLEGAPLEIFVPGEQMHHLDFRGLHPASRTAAFDPDALHEQARTELGHLNNFLRDGIHSGVDMTTDSIEYHPHAHRVEMTPHWAGEAIGLDTAANFSRRTRARAGQYESVLSRMVSKGPMDTQGGYLPPAHEHLDSARNHFRVELQHGNHFVVPDLSAFSRLRNLTDADALGAVNPRYHHGTGGRTPEARDAYKVNCQRCVLALDARHKGYNVEARANFRDVGNPYADEQLKDNHIADWWKDQNGMPGAWIDVEDLPDPSKRPDDGSDIANPKRRERYLRENADSLHPKLVDNPGPHHWDHMADVMASWGEGARGLIATTRHRPGGYMRHVIHARVGPGGKIAYDDPQDPTGFADHGAHWREHTAYGLSIYSKAERDEGASLYDSPIARIRHRNMKHSPLRFMRVDDKTLTSSAAKYLVDRGTAGPEPITPPRNI